MSGFDSPNFKKNTSPSVAQRPVMREYTVGAPPTDQQQIPMQNMELPFQPGSASQMSIEEAKEAAARARTARAEGPRIGDAGKKRIELLAGIGRLTKDIDIGGIIFSIKTLKVKETREASVAVFSTSLTQIEASFEARKQQLARSIYQIDGQDINLVIGSENLDDKLSFIEELEEVVVNKLWDDFTELKLEAKTKYGITTQKDVGEVSEDLKK